jgi:hypothetical protein
VHPGRSSAENRSRRKVAFPVHYIHYVIVDPAGAFISYTVLLFRLSRPTFPDSIAPKLFGSVSFFRYGRYPHSKSIRSERVRSMFTILVIFGWALSLLLFILYVSKDEPWSKRLRKWCVLN